jgi:hypothetical protein
MSMGKLSRVFFAVTLLGIVYLAWVFGGRALRRGQWAREHEQPSTANSEFARTYGGTEVRILQFYAREGNLTEGGKSAICYGVLNAKSVRIEPPLQGVYPALSRCVEAAPTRETRYTLTAEGEDGRTVSESFVLGVHADQERLPRITTFAVAKRQRDYSGKWIFSLSFAAQNAEEVTIDPPVFPPLHGTPFGSVPVAPEKTTTYTLTVKGKFGHVTQRQLTVQVPPQG